MDPTPGSAPASTVQVDFTLAVGAGRLNASLDVPAGDITLTQLLPVLQTLSSNIIDSACQIVRSEGYEISCRVGCGSCCRQLVPLSLFEAESLADWIHSLPLDRQQQLESRFNATLQALKDTGILARMDPVHWDDGSVDAKSLDIDYHRQYIACPFLENESCSIHSFRPFACREYLVTSPPALCDDPEKNPVVGVPIPLKVSKVLFKLGGQLEANSRGWIPLVFLFAWMQSGAQPGKAIAGPGPELLYEVVKRLTPA